MSYTYERIINTEKKIIYTIIAKYLSFIWIYLYRKSKIEVNITTFLIVESS